MQHQMYYNLLYRYDPSVQIHDMCVRWYPDTDAIHIYWRDYFCDLSEFDNDYILSVFCANKPLVYFKHFDSFESVKNKLDEFFPLSLFAI